MYEGRRRRCSRSAPVVWFCSTEPFHTSLISGEKRVLAESAQTHLSVNLWLRPLLLSSVHVKLNLEQTEERLRSPSAQESRNLQRPKTGSHVFSTAKKIQHGGFFSGLLIQHVDSATSAVYWRLQRLTAARTPRRGPDGWLWERRGRLDPNQSSGGLRR